MSPSPPFDPASLELGCRDGQAHRRALLRALAGLLGLAVCGGRPGAGQAGEPSADARRPLTFVHPAGVRPFSYADADGRTVGLAVDIIDLLLTGTPWRQQPVLVPWARAQLMLREGRADGILTAATGDRRPYLDFCAHTVVDLRMGAWYRAGDRRFAGVRVMADLGGMRQGNYLGNSLLAEVLGANALKTINWASTPETALRMLLAGRTDAIIHEAHFFTFMAETLGVGDKIAFAPLADLPAPPFTVGIRASHPDHQAIVATLDRAIVAHHDAIRALENHYHQA